MEETEVESKNFKILISRFESGDTKLLERREMWEGGVETQENDQIFVSL